MKSFQRATLATLTASFFLSACSHQAPRKSADLLLTHGYIYTVDSKRSVAQALAITDGKISFVGSNDEAMKLQDANTVVKNLAGKMVLPGLHDMHIHALGSVKPDMCDLDGKGMSLEALVSIVQDCVKKYQPEKGAWLPVLQWNPFEGNQPSDRYPTLRAALDAAAADNPIMMWGNDGHHGAVNSLALASPEIPINASTLKTTYAEYQSLVGVDTKGEPSGAMTEGARNILRANMDDDMLGVSGTSEWLMPRVAAKMAENGITSIQDAAVRESVLDHYQWLDNNNGMTFRLRAALIADSDHGKLPSSIATVQDTIEQLNHMRDSTRGAKYIRANAMKVFADGVLEGNPYGEPPTLPNAAMIDGFHQPIYTVNKETGNADVTAYVDLDSEICRSVQASPTDFEDVEAAMAFKKSQGYMPSQCQRQNGQLEGNEEVIKHLVTRATEEGYHVHIHAIADRAVRLAAEAFEESKAKADELGLTQSIAHVQIAKPEDIKRHGVLGTYVAFTYSWATPEPEYEMVVVPFIDKVDGLEDLYNPDHYYTRNAYPFKTILDSGAVPVFGSDAPVGSRDPRPFENMMSALQRESDGIVLNAAERLNIHEAIASYTINGASMMARKDELGSLEIGKLADVIVLDRNIVDLAESGKTTEIGNTRVVATIFDGKIVFDKTQ